MPDHYETLGVAPTAPETVIRAAYRARMRDVHPDAGGHAGDAQQVNQAYSVLSNAVSRADYDRAIAPRPGGDPAADGAESGTAAPPMFRREPDPFHVARSQPRVVPPAEVAEGQTPAPTRWARSRIVWAAAGLAAAGVLVLLLWEPAAWTQWRLVSAALIVGGAVTAICIRALLGVAMIASSLAVPGGPEWVWWVTVVAVVLCLTAVAVSSWARRRELRAWQVIRAERVIETAKQHGVGVFTVDAAEQALALTVAVLTDVETGARHHRSVVGAVQAGDVVAFDYGRGVVLASATVRDFRLATKRARRVR